jgi:hypothetical protein
MSEITPTSYPSTPLDKVKDISSHLGNLLGSFQTDSEQPTSPSRDPTSTRDLNALLDCFRRQQTAIEALTQPPPPPLNPPTISRSTPVTPDYFGNAKYEDIICKPLKPLYDSTRFGILPQSSRYSSS